MIMELLDYFHGTIWNYDDYKLSQIRAFSRMRIHSQLAQALLNILYFHVDEFIFRK